MRITWITRNFLDYRIPVYEEINKLCHNNLTVIYYADVVPTRCQEKIKKILGVRAIGLKGEIRIGGAKVQSVSTLGEKRVRIPIQPGLIRTAIESGPEVLISDGFFQWTYAALWLRLFKGIPHVMCYEGTRFTERNRGLLRTYYRKQVSKLIDHITCNGELCAEYVEWLGYPHAKISLGNMAADTENLRKNTQEITDKENSNLKETLGLNKFVFLYIGRLVPLKGVDKLVRAWSEVFESNSEASLLIVGSGPEKANLEKLFMGKSDSNIVFAGDVDYSVVYKYFAVSDILVMPTLQDNWSLVVPEAMSCGLPVICSKYNGCWPELVKPENGWIFDPLDAIGFSETLKTAWKERFKWKTMGQKSLGIVQDHSPGKTALSIYKACESSLSK